MNASLPSSSITLRKLPKVWHKGRDIALPVSAVALILLLWQASTAVFDIPDWQLPPPTTIITELGPNADLLLQNAIHTSVSVVIGYVLGVVVAIPIAVGIAFSRTVSTTVYPLLAGYNALPKSALAPLLLVWLGFGRPMEVAIVFSICLFPVIINTAIGLSSMPQELSYLAQSMGGGRFRTFWKIRLPYALPFIFGGLKVAISLAVVGAIVGEFVASNEGLGYLMLRSASNFETSLVFCSLLVLSVVAYVMFAAVQLAERMFVGRTGPTRR
jgi:NitT/TauT family transport system permease protein